MTRVHAFTTDDALGDHDAVALGRLLRRGEVSVRELVDAAIARAQTLQPTLNPVQHEDYERASATADRLDADGLGDGLLSGIPVFLKDNVDVAGVPTLHGSSAFTGRTATKDGPVAAHWRGLGSVFLGKSRLPEFGFSASTEYAAEDPVRNPWDPAYSSGASSGGSAALVAGGAVPLAHANDGGGSIRIPAAACGLVGLKPTRGRLPADHVDRVLPVPIVAQGAVTRTVRDTAAFLAASEQVRPARGRLPRIGLVEGTATRRLRIGVLLDSVHGTPTDQPTREAVERVAELLAGHGHHVEPIPMPVEARFADDFVLLWSLLAVMASRTGRLLLARDFDVALTDPLTRGLAQQAGRRLQHLPATLWRLRRVEGQYREVMRRWDLVLSPTLGHVVPPIGHLSPNQDFGQLMSKLVEYVGFTPLANVAGAPAISLPVGLTEGDHLPVAAMLSAGHGDERTLLEVAYEVEAALDVPRITG